MLEPVFNLSPEYRGVNPGDRENRRQRAIPHSLCPCDDASTLSFSGSREKKPAGNCDWNCWNQIIEDDVTRKMAEPAFLYLMA